MYRLSGPKLFLFIPVVIIGIVCVLFTPLYFNTTRVLSLSALMIGEAGLSFIPVLAFYPKARPLQAGILAIIYFFTTLIISFTVWSLNSFGIPQESAFLVKDGEFHINIYGLFASNLMSLLALVSNFRLIYDEELTKEQNKKMKYQQKQGIVPTHSSSPRHPNFESTKEPIQGAKPFKEPALEEDFLRPFEFEPQLDLSLENLPEESSGKLFYSESEKKEETFEETILSKKIKFDEPEEPPTPIKAPPKPKVSPFPPQNIKDDLQAIFEQYSSLNSVKKLTSGITDKPQLKRKEIEKRPTRKPYTLPKQQISVEVKDEDVHEASFRTISEEEKLNELKEELKKELKAELQSKLKENTPPAKDKSETIFNDIFVKEEPQPVKAQEVDQIKEELIQSIKSIKDELLESLKQEIKKELIEENTLPAASNTPVEEKEDYSEYKEKLSLISKEAQVNGALFLNPNGTIIAESWKEQPVLHKKQHSNIPLVFNSLCKQINKTNQGSNYHILLESENGTIVLESVENKILTVYSKGTGEANSGQILRALLESEEN